MRNYDDVAPIHVYTGMQVGWSSRSYKLSCMYLVALVKPLLTY
jgi:hypothetical protein